MSDSVIIPIPDDYKRVDPGNGICEVTLIDRRQRGAVVQIQVPKLDASGQPWTRGQKKMIVGNQGLEADTEAAFDRVTGSQLLTDARLFIEREVMPGETIRELIDYPEGNVQAIKAWLV